jgi:DNA primase
MARISQETISCLQMLSCEDVAERLGIEVQRHKTLCFMHEDHHPSMAFLGENRERWNCFVCNKGGHAIDLVTEYTDLNFVEACQWLCKIFGISLDNYSPAKSSMKVIRIKKRQKLEDVEKPFSTVVAQWILDNSSLSEQGKEFLFGKRLLNAEVANQLNIVSIDNSQLLIEKMVKAFDSRTLQDSGFITVNNGKFFFRFFTPCLLFPYYDKENILIGMQSRYLGTKEDAPRFQFISTHKTRLFNLPILNTMRFGEDLYISEGITDCLALLSAGKKAVAIPSATILPQFDLIKLKTYKLHMYPDQDNAGKQAYVKLRRFFINHYAMIKSEQLPEGVKDYSEYYISIHGGQEG